MESSSPRAASTSLPRRCAVAFAVLSAGFYCFVIGLTLGPSVWELTELVLVLVGGGVVTLAAITAAVVVSVRAGRGQRLWSVAARPLALGGLSVGLCFAGLAWSLWIDPLDNVALALQMLVPLGCGAAAVGMAAVPDMPLAAACLVRAVGILTAGPYCLALGLLHGSVLEAAVVFANFYPFLAGSVLGTVSGSAALIAGNIPLTRAQHRSGPGRGAMLTGVITGVLPLLYMLTFAIMISYATD